MRRWISMIALLAVPCAHAGPYSDAVRSQELCQTMGQMGMLAYRARPASAPQMSSDQLHDAASASMDQVNATQQLPGGVEGRIIRQTVDHAFMSAPDAQDAYGYGWGHCMDEYGPAQ